jgi:hypothetical protein
LEKKRKSDIGIEAQWKRRVEEEKEKIDVRRAEEKSREGYKWKSRKFPSH